MGLLGRFRRSSNDGVENHPEMPPPKQEPEEPVLLIRLGGMAHLNEIVNDFIDRVSTDQRLLVFFEGVDYRVLALHQKRFFTMAFTKVPDSANLELVIKKHHQRLFERGLDERHYDIVIGEHMVGAIRAQGFSDAIVSEVLCILAPLRKAFEKAAWEATWDYRVPTSSHMKGQTIATLCFSDK
ncbi:truncated hemoglobin GlbN [Seminavis robusta]|uniref:Truncated hemoglobin GlbN n=1 Tax=Seminavis robusta TaxID=568900 RepID=A0A9N8HZQ5_9STRA|nr:truncated hemoglobin GlbN [Seminavis robusta]|eukprot:Sro2353_g324460.1 truncated hemoglobin GlbN (183) ;mRNA; f:7459-8007